MPTSKDKPTREAAPIQLMNEREQAIVSALKAKCDELGISSARFAKEYLDCSKATWWKICKNEYRGATSRKVDDFAKVLERIKDLKSIPAQKSQADEEPIFETDTLLALKKAVLKAYNRVDDMRLVIFRAQTGGGKDTAIRHIARTVNDTDRTIVNVLNVEATEVWRNSYYACCCQMLRALGCDSFGKSKLEAENALLAQLNMRKYLVAVNEANYFGPQAFNLLKIIINQTKSSVLICTIPEIFEKLKLRSWWEASQLINRSTVVITAPPITADDVEPFLGGIDFESDDVAEAACQMAAHAANSFGLFRQVKRVVENLSGKSKVSLSDVERAVSKAQAFLQIYDRRK